MAVGMCRGVCMRRRDGPDAEMSGASRAGLQWLTLPTGSRG